MDIGSYLAASSGVLQMKKLEVQNNNLANISTIGFKGQYVVTSSQTFDNTLASTIDRYDPYGKDDQSRLPGVTDIRTQIDFSMGPIQQTGNPLDAALRSPNEFFVVETPEGDRYTRAGNFSLSSEGQLVTADGFKVKGDGGPIVAQAAGVAILPNGSVTAGPAIGGVPNIVGRIRVVKFEDTARLESVEGTRFKAPDDLRPTPVETLIEPQSLEMSNVSAISGMVDLISTNRAFQAYTKAAQTLDSLNQIAVSQVGRRRR
jgi:flagellar basal-body rod protein FlgF